MIPPHTALSQSSQAHCHQKYHWSSATWEAIKTPSCPHGASKGLEAQDRLPHLCAKSSVTQSPEAEISAHNEASKKRVKGLLVRGGCRIFLRIAHSPTQTWPSRRTGLGGWGFRGIRNGHQVVRNCYVHAGTFPWGIVKEKIEQLIITRP